jgi:hypothetical protein
MKLVFTENKIKDQSCWSSPTNLNLIRNLLSLADFVNLWMNKLKEQNFVVEWVNFANRDYIYQLLELNKNLEYLLTNY